MARRRMGTLILLLCFCLCWMPCHVLAAPTSDAIEPIATDRACTLTITYRCEGTVFSDLPVKLYKIAEVSADCQYTLTPSFANSGLALNGIQSTGEWNVIRSTLEAHILSHGIEADRTAVTDQAGQVCFEALQPGLYLAAAEPGIQEDVICRFASALVALPGLDAEGLWQYQISVFSKPEVIPPTDEEIQFRILKLWKGDQDSANRPAGIVVEIFRDGIRYEIVTLSEDNHWSYSWTAKDDGADWTVLERDIPPGYTVTVEKRDTTFILTNIWNPENPDIPEEPTIPGNPDIPTNPDGPTDPDQPDTPDSPDVPQTGDTANILLYIVLMYVSGSMLIILGMTGKKIRR